MTDRARELVERLRRYAEAIERTDSGKKGELHVGPMMCANAMLEAAALLDTSRAVDEPTEAEADQVKSVYGLAETPSPAEQNADLPELARAEAEELHRANLSYGVGHALGTASNLLERAADEIDRLRRFLEAILERTPNGEWIEVQYHPDGDWSVAHKPLVDEPTEADEDLPTAEDVRGILGPAVVDEPTEAVERVARAIAEAAAGDSSARLFWEQWTDEARAAIAAMRAAQGERG